MSVRKKALAEFLELKSTRGIKESSYDKHCFDAEGREYMVLTDKEADKKLIEEIENSLWAFRAEFLTHYLKMPVEAIRAVQEKMYESASPVFRKMLTDRDFKKLVDEAELSDGRGHFLSRYDGEENEQGKFFIYRTN